MILTALIAIVVVAAVWNLILKILVGLVLSDSLDPSDYTAFQTVFGMIFAVIIALEFKKSLLVVAARRETVVQIRSVVVIALLAICRKVIILDPTETDALHIVALAAAILALGIIEQSWRSPRAARRRRAGISVSGGRGRKCRRPEASWCRTLGTNEQSCIDGCQ